MEAFNKKQGSVLFAVVFFLTAIAGGCATTTSSGIKYSYDSRVSFAERKSYTWAPVSSAYRKDPLLEANVQAFADQILAQKGFTRASGKPDLMMSVGYEFEIDVTDDIYRVRTLSVYVYTADARELLWRGTAFGTIRTDAGTGELKQAVQGILSHFPPN